MISRKRKDAGQEGGRRTKRKKSAVGEEDWGLSDWNKCASGAFLYSGLEGVPKPSGALVPTRMCRSRALEAVDVTNCKITEWTKPAVNKAQEMNNDQTECVSNEPVLAIEWNGSKWLAIEWKNYEP